MQPLVQVSFHDLAPSPALEIAARQEISTLERVFGRMVSCRVAIEAPHQHHHKGQVFRVRIEIGVPGRHIVVGHAPPDHTEHADPRLALRDAFRVARRQLEEHTRYRRGELRPHAAL